MQETNKPFGSCPRNKGVCPRKSTCKRNRRKILLVLAIQWTNMQQQSDHFHQCKAPVTVRKIGIPRCWILRTRFAFRLLLILLSVDPLCFFQCLRLVFRHFPYMDSTLQRNIRQRSSSGSYSIAWAHNPLGIWVKRNAVDGCLFRASSQFTGTVTATRNIEHSDQRALQWKICNRKVEGVGPPDIFLELHELLRISHNVYFLGKANHFDQRPFVHCNNLPLF